VQLPLLWCNYRLSIRCFYRKNVAEKEMGSAEQEANRIVSDAIKTAESRKKEALIEAKDEIFRQRTEADKELKERRSRSSAWSAE
jgi:ribonuclease Y